MRILVDQDGVLADYNKLLLERVYQRFPELPKLPLEQLVHFNTEQHFPKAYWDQIEALTMEKDFFSSIPVIPGAKEALETLKAGGHDVWICTKPKRPSRDPFCACNKLAWINKHLGGYWADRTILTRDKTLVNGDILIDDHPNAGKNGSQEPNWTHFVYDQPYNRNSRPVWRISWCGVWLQTILQFEDDIPF